MKKYLLFFIGLGMIWISCESKIDQFILEPKDTPPLKFKALPDTLLPPEVFHLDESKRPKAFSTSVKKFPLKTPYGLGQVNITQFGIADGLASDANQDLAIDSNGTLWIGGIGFLSKYDGSKFTSIPSSAGFGSGFISNILFDSKENLWIANFDGVFRFDGQTFEEINLGDVSKNELGISGILPDKNGAIWIPTFQGVMKIEGDSTVKYNTENGLSDNDVHSVLENEEGQILVATHQGIDVLEGEKFIPYPDFQITNGRLMYTDSKGNLWFWYYEEDLAVLGYFDGEKTHIIEIERFSTGNFFIQDIYESRSGTIWILTGRGLFSYQNGKVLDYSDHPLMKDIGGNSLIEDDAGNLWVGGLNGIFRIDFNIQNRLEEPFDSGKPIESNDLEIGKDGIKWLIGGDNYSLLKYEESEVIQYDFKSYLKDRFFHELHIDINGEIWLSMGGPDRNNRELLRFDGKSFYAYGKEQGLKIEFVQGMTEDKSGNLLLYGDNGIQTFDGNTFTYYGPDQGFPEQISAFLEDSRSVKWMGSNAQRLYKIDQDSILVITEDFGLPLGFVNSINEDPMGNIWFATDGGLSRIYQGKLQTFGYSDGVGNVVANILTDTALNTLWIGTNIGLVHFPFSEINKEEPQFTLFSRRNGYDLIPGMYSNNQGLYLDSSGIWMPGLTDGVFRFDYKKVQQIPPPPLKIQNIRINNSNVLWSQILGSQENKYNSQMLKNESVLKFGKVADQRKLEELEKRFSDISIDGLQEGGFIPENLQLPYKNNLIVFEFSAISLTFGKHTQYRYRLLGYNENWSPLSTKNEALFGNMNEGNYTFELEAITTYGAKSALSYTFQVLPPWYRSWWAYLIYFFAFAAIVRWIYSFQKKRLITREKEKAREKELAQAKEIEKAYTELKSTQAQLIQSEKMASLGELTAGIAHEIQNPLNFVNNFSEVSNELLDEMNEELTKGDLDEVKTIASELKENLSKINHHGKRAGSIVKGMLEHSRKSDGKKELTDINKMADESLRLSFHGLRAKDKEFHSDFKLDLDPDLPEIEVVPQDIGRVLLNLINNAFYACAERSRSTGNEKAKTTVEVYKPKVTVSTRKTESGIELSVADNGSGIPDAIKEKIFQPFFTTKPTGQGTGLGLSLSYDIIKAHGGRIEVKSEANQGSEFIIYFPI